MSVKLLVGTQWGDEGKAKVIDYLSGETDYIIRYQGGANAGHTVKVDGETYVFHLIPSGILYPKTICILGGGMVIDSEALFSEIDNLENRGIEVKKRIRIADNVHILLPYHKIIDKAIESNLGDQKIGTTHRGIGVCYGDKVNRNGIRAGELVSEAFYKKRLPLLIEQKNIILERIYGKPCLDISEVEQSLRDLGQKIQPLLINLPYYLNMECASGKKVLLEGAQGTMLDLDYGTYPYVTSSNPTTGGALIGSGIDFHHLKEVVGITKAYCTRVGEGPFPTELFGNQAEYLRNQGEEFGATTGRPRRVGWFDVEVVRHSVRINGLSSIALTKLDVLDSLDEIQIGMGYELNGHRISYFPSYDIDQVKVLYQTLPGWKENISKCKSFDDLPKNARKYIQTIEKFCGVPIRWISVGPSRESTIHLK